MARCNSTFDLEVHHKRRDGGNGLDNAEVLCRRCHAATSTYGVEGSSPPPFDPLTKAVARLHAENRCECVRIGGCH